MRSGDHVKIVGTDQYGAPTTLTGYASAPQPVRVGRRGSSVRRDMLSFQVTETPSGANGWRGQVIVEPGATVERVEPKPEVPERPRMIPSSQTMSSGISARTGKRIKPNPVRPIGTLDRTPVKAQTGGMTSSSSATTEAIDQTIGRLEATMATRAATELRGIRDRAAKPETSVADTIAEIRIAARNAPTDIKQELRNLTARLQRADTQRFEGAAREGLGEDAAARVRVPGAPGEMTATISTGPKGRTTTVTLPDGTTATRTSKTRDYTHAVVVTEDNHAHAAEIRKGVARRQAFIDALERWIAEGADTSKLRAYPSGSRSYAEQQAGISPNEYYLPGFEPVKVQSTTRGFGHHSYWSDPSGFSLPNFNDKRLQYSADRYGLAPDTLTAWEAYGPDHVLKQQREFIEHETAQAKKLEAQPQYGYGVWRWSASADNAQSYANTVDATRPWRTTRVVGVEGATGRKAEGEGSGAATFDPADAAKRVREMTPDEARAYVDTLRAPQVRKLAEQLGALAANRAQLDYLKQRIVAHASEG